MAVTKGANEIILEERKKEFFAHVVPDFISGAKKIGITDEVLIQIVKENLHD